MEDEVNKGLQETFSDFLPAPPDPEPPAPPVETPPAEPPAPPSEPPVEPPVEPPTPPVEPPAEPPVPPAVPPAEPPAPEPTELELERARNVELMKMVSGAQKPSPGAAPEPPAPIVDGVFKFVEKDEDIDKVLKTPEAFNTFMTGVVVKAVEGALRKLPEVVIPMARNQVSIMSTIQDFYQSNKDLLQYKEFVGYVANEISAKRPELSLAELLDESEKEVRTRLKLKKAAEAGVMPPIAPAPGAPPPAAAPTPGFVPTNPGSRPAPAGARADALDKLSNEIMELAEL